MTKKKMISLMLVVVSLLLFCSFSVYADDTVVSMSSASVQLQRQVVEGSTTSTYNYAHTDGIEVWHGETCHYYKAVNPEYYASGANKLLNAFSYSGLEAGHEYEMSFGVGINFRCDFSLKIYVGDSCIYDQKITNNSQLHTIKAKFTSPEVVSGNTSIRIYLTVDKGYNYGADGQNVKYYFTESVNFYDRTDNPSWLGKILDKFSEIRQSFANLTSAIGQFFDGLGESIGTFFSDLWKNIKQKFDDLKTWIDGLGENIKQWFTDLGNDISDFFTMLKNYLLYFQHPVTVNADGVLIGKDGKPVYTNPFDSAIDKVKETVDDWLAKINDFVESMESSRLSVTGYLESGSGVVNKVLKASPILSACVLFAVGFLVIRKVVGR